MGINEHIEELFQIFQVEENLDIINNYIVYGIEDKFDLEIESLCIILTHKVKGRNKSLSLNYFDQIISKVEPVTHIWNNVKMDNSYNVTPSKSDINYLKLFNDDYLINSTKSKINFDIKIKNKEKDITEFLLKLSKNLSRLGFKTYKLTGDKESNIETGDIVDRIRIYKSIKIESEIDKNKIPPNLITKFDEFIKKYSIPIGGQKDLIDLLKNK
jgi:hypothetical protein